MTNGTQPSDSKIEEKKVIADAVLNLVQISFTSIRGMFLITLGAMAAVLTFVGRSGNGSSYREDFNLLSLIFVGFVVSLIFSMFSYDARYQSRRLLLKCGKPFHPVENLELNFFKTIGDEGELNFKDAKALYHISRSYLTASALSLVGAMISSAAMVSCKPSVCEGFISKSGIIIGLVLATSLIFFIRQCLRRESGWIKEKTTLIANFIKMKKVPLTVNVSISLVLIGAWFLYSSSRESPLPPEQRTLKLAYFMSASHPMNKGLFAPFSKNLTNISSDRLQVTQYPGGVLGSKPPQQYAFLLQKRSDIAFVVPDYTPDLFPLTNLISTPGVCSDALECTELLLTKRKWVEKEYEAKVLALWANNPSVLISKSQINSVNDLKGLKIRTSSKQETYIYKNLGAEPVSIPASELNRSLSTGLIDAVSIGPSGLKSFKLNEVANFVLTNPIGSSKPFVLLMNKDSYENMSDEEKGWISNASENTLSLGAAEVYKSLGEKVISEMKEQRMIVSEFSAEDLKTVDNLVKRMLEGSYPDLNKGVPRSALFDSVFMRVNKYD